MSDDLDWDDDDFEVSDFPTVGQQKVAKEMIQKFEGEDEEEEPEQKAEPPQPKVAQAKEPSKYANRGVAAPVEEPLDDPVAEKLRQAKRQEEADFRHTVEMFGGDSTQKLEGFVPASAKDFEDHYKSLLKHILKDVSSSLSSGEIKDLENCLSGARVEKQRLEKAEKENAAKKGKKATLKFEKTSMSAGLDADAIYEDVVDDDYEFM